MKVFEPVILLLFLLACDQQPRPVKQEADTIRALPTIATESKSNNAPLPFNGNDLIETGLLTADSLLQFAYTLIGTPYQYASANPATGFDCSGFITYVFNHFNVAVPRSSIDFTNIQKEIALPEARPGDLILFTGTDSLIRNVGHMGIVNNVNSNGEISFIHSTSGRANGVTITLLNDYYRGRFVKIVRVLK